MRAFLAPPEMSDPVDQGKARTLHWILTRSCVIGVLLTLSTPLLAPDEPVASLIYLSSVVVMGAGIVLIHRGRLRLVAGVFPAFVLVLTCSALVHYGARSPALLGFVIAVLFAGLFHSPRAALAFGVSSVFMMLVYFIAEDAGMIPPHDPMSRTRLWLGATAAIVATILLVYFAVRSARTSLEIALRVEEALRESERKLHYAQRMEALGMLAGGVSHDINNILSVILANASTLALGGLDDAERSLCVEEIEEAATRGGELTNQLLTFSRQQVLEPRVSDAHRVLEGVERMLRRIIGEDIALIVEFGEDVGHVTVDRGQMAQALMNLAVNARSAMPRGGTLRIATADLVVNGTDETLPGVEPGHYFHLLVADDGEGMDALTREHAFEPFFTTKGQEGTGLGLAMVQGLVVQSGGAIWIESEVGRGTTIHIVLPVTKAAESSDDGGSNPPIPRGGELVRLLLVEDDPLVRRATRRVLEAQGYSVTECNDGDEALAMTDAELGNVDVLLTDVVMPGSSGVDVARSLSTRHPGLGVVFVSGYAPGLDIGAVCTEIGAAFLPKPFSAQELRRTVESVRKPGPDAPLPDADAPPDQET